MAVFSRTAVIINAKKEEDELKNPPKLIRELLNENWLKSIFNNCKFDPSISPKFRYNEGLYTHELIALNNIQFESFNAQSFRIHESKYFFNFSIEFSTSKTEIFTKRDEYCLNKFFTKRNSWHYSGSRMANYKYIEEDRITGLIISKLSESTIGVVLSHSTIYKQAKTNIELNIILNGNFHISNKATELTYNDYSDLSESELKSIKEWKNIEVSKESQLAKNQMFKWIENLYECTVHEPTKTIRSIYLNEEHKNEIERLISQSKEGKIKLDGEFKMFSDYTAILETINKLELEKQ